MTDDLDRALRGTLSTAAREAPGLPPELLERVEAGHHRRRRRRAAAAGLAVAVAVAGTGVAGALARSADEAAPVAADGRLKPLSPADLGTPVKVRERWPDAVRSVPGRLPNGRELHPVELLGDGTLVAATWSSLQMPDKLWSYDLAAGEARTITDIVVPRGSRIYASDFTIAGDQVVWWLSYRAKGGDRVEVWGAPLAGGAAHKITGLPGRDVSTLLAEEDGVVLATSDGVYRAPLAGGAAERIPGTEGFEIVSWPWIGSPASLKGGVGYIRYRTLWNVSTGERRKARLAPFEGAWTCGVTWCVGGPASGVTYHGDVKTAVQRRDGKAGRTLPGDRVGPTQPPIYGRYLAYFPEGPAKTKTHILYDIESGRLLDTGIRRSNEVLGSVRNNQDPQYFLEAEGGTVLLDLSKIR